MIPTFVAAYLVGLGLDLWSTWFCMRAFGDPGLADEFNPLVRGTSFPGMVCHAAMLALIVVGIFYLGWRRREGLYPARGKNLRGFWDHVLGLASGRTDAASTVRRRWGSMLILVCVIGPMVLGVGHYRVAVTNTLQGMGLIRWGSLGIFITVRVSEVVLYSLLGAWILFLDYRRSAH